MKPFAISLVLFVAVCTCISAFADTPTITGVTARQRYPWNGKVDISYTVTGDFTGYVEPTLRVTATDRTTGNTYTASTLTGDTGLTAGTHSLVWDMNADGMAFKSDDVVFDVTCEALKPFCVVDLSAGAGASSYPVTYLMSPPLSGFNTDEYKTTKLVLRCLEPGPIPTRAATITKPFYIGLFEVTQKQWSLVTGSNPSAHKGDKRPVELVSYNDIRGSSLGAQWPASSVVDSDSFLGRLRARTGLDFDLPTEAQWEYACRAETTSDYNNGGNAENDLKMLGRYSGNGGKAYSHAIVGSYLPNAWGLYDMHGNVDERCLDWAGTFLFGNDPVGSSSGSDRVVRGGCYADNASACTSSASDQGDCRPSTSTSGTGFRLVRALSD